jgi:hypothetical protein
MNYIKQLEREREAKTRAVDAVTAAMDEFRAHLRTAKFQGEGNDYINTSDVFRWLDYIRDQMRDAEFCLSQCPEINTAELGRLLLTDAGFRKWASGQAASLEPSDYKVTEQQKMV